MDQGSASLCSLLHEMREYLRKHWPWLLLLLAVWTAVVLLVGPEPPEIG